MANISEHKYYHDGHEFNVIRTDSILIKGDGIFSFVVRDDEQDKNPLRLRFKVVYDLESDQNAVVDADLESNTLTISLGHSKKYSGFAHFIPLSVALLKNNRAVYVTWSLHYIGQGAVMTINTLEGEQKNG